MRFAIYFLLAVIFFIGDQMTRSGSGVDAASTKRGGTQKLGDDLETIVNREAAKFSNLNITVAKIA